MNPSDKFTGFKSAVMAKNGQETSEIDLGGIYEKILVIIPTIDAAAVSVKISNETGGTFYPVHDWLDADGDGTVLQATASGTGGIAAVFKIGGAEFVKVYAGAAQTTAARTFLVRGIR